MRLNYGQKIEALRHLQRLGMDLQPELFSFEDDQRVAKAVLQFLSTFRNLHISGTMAIRKIERQCESILAKRRPG